MFSSLSFDFKNGCVTYTEGSGEKVKFTDPDLKSKYRKILAASGIEDGFLLEANVDWDAERAVI